MTVTRQQGTNPPTKEQQRAADAWRCSEGCVPGYDKVAKSVPALIMTSGLMQTIAFLEDKGNQNGGQDLNRQLRRWLAREFPDVFNGAEYEPFMEALVQADPERFQAITAEARAWLRWLRQIAPTRAPANG